jgi:signal transduction histidine kinase
MEELFKSAIVLKSGILYNLTASLIIVASGLFASFSILSWARRNLESRSFAVFLSALSTFWLFSGLINLCAFLNLLPILPYLQFPLKLMLACQIASLGTYLVYRISKQEKMALVLFPSAALVLFILSLVETGAYSVGYWGVQWHNGSYAQLWFFALLVPLFLLTLVDLFRNSRTKLDTSLPLSILIYLLVSGLDFASVGIEWNLLLIRLAYLAVVAAAYLQFLGEAIAEEKFISVGEKIKKAERRRPFFLKLLGLLLLISILPISLATGLMYLTFAEIIDLYVYKPLLWGMKASREQFLLALKNAQVQVLFLMSLTLSLVIAAAVLVSRGIAESLKRVSLGMKRISSGDFSFRIRRESNDEIGDLVNYFNDMSGEIKRARDILENWNRELDAKVKKKTQQLREAYEQLISLDKLKTEFVSNVSHELRTPLTHIENFVSLFYDGLLGPVSEEQKPHLKTIREANQRELSLVNRLLNFSEMESGKFFLSREPLHLQPLVLEVLDKLKAKLEEKKAQVTTNLNASKDGFSGNREKMLFCLMDLLDNAIKFSPDNPIILLETQNTDDTLLLSIKDNGIGIPKDKLEKVFDKFFQVDASWTRKYGGTGLGLAVIKHILEAHEGKIWAESEGEGKGTKIVIQLPSIYM